MIQHRIVAIAIAAVFVMSSAVPTWAASTTTTTPPAATEKTPTADKTKVEKKDGKAAPVVTTPEKSKDKAEKAVKNTEKASTADNKEGKAEKKVTKKEAKGAKKDEKYVEKAKGLDNAEHKAGEHGEKGRDTAGAKQSK